MRLRDAKLGWLFALLQCGGSDAPSSTSDDIAVTPTDASTTGVATATAGNGSAGSAGTRGPDAGEPTTSGGGAASSTGDDGEVPVDELSDEFDDPSTLASWSVREEIEGGLPAAERIAIVDGRLEMVPTAGGWYGDWVGALLFKAVSGDFVVEVHLTAVSRTNPEAPPGLPFNSGGLLVRDPASVPGDQNWIAHNVGYQSASVATEGKTTVGSQSTLVLVEGIHHGRLRMCRVGDTFMLARQLDDESAWTETHRYDRPDLPALLQVGMMANGWNSTGADPDLNLTPDVDVSFDYVRFHRPADEGDCLR